MLLPYNSDTPLKTWPYGTFGLIGTCVAVYVLCELEVIDPVDHVLVLGEGLQPIRWLTSAFIHVGLDHLLGNMLFLWIFGRTVEGIGGWWRLVTLFVGVAVLESALEQIIFRPDEIVLTFGSSSAIFGLVAVSIFWSPRSRVMVFYFFITLIGVARPRLWAVAGYYLLVDVAIFWLTYGSWKEAVSSSALHLMGALVGAVLGIAFLAFRWVDTDGYDFWSLWHEKKDYGLPNRSASLPDPTSQPEDPQVASEELEVETEMLRQNLEADDFANAIAIYRDVVREHGGWSLNEPDLRRLTIAAVRHRSAAVGFKLAEQYTRRFPAGHVPIRMLHVRALLQRQKPSAALTLLGTIPSDSDPTIEAQRDTLAAEARKQIADGVLELEAPEDE